MGKTARNEMRKLEATFFNNLGIASFATGFLTSYFSLFAGQIHFGHVFAGVAGLAVGLFAHWQARKFIVHIED